MDFGTKPKLQKNLIEQSIEAKQQLNNEADELDDEVIILFWQWLCFWFPLADFLVIYDTRKLMEMSALVLMAIH